MADTTLTAIRTKFRRLARAQSVNQLSNADIDQYINTFLLYDLPSTLRLTDLKKEYTFYTRPNVDKYDQITLGLSSQPLFNFNNIVNGTFGPFYVAGYRAAFSQSREEFYGRWPTLNQKIQIGTGDGITISFTGTLANVPILANNFTVSSIDANNLQIVLQDIPVVDGNGIQTQTGNLAEPNGTATTSIDVNNFVDYIDGTYTITFATPPGNGQPVWVMYYSYAAARPTSILFFDNTFYLRPVPDIPYPVRFEVFIQPIELLADNQSPQLEQWWQYIAYGGAIKFLQDQNRSEDVAALLPEFKNQELLVLRRTLAQQGDDRAATIYSQQTSLYGSPWGWWNGFNS